MDIEDKIKKLLDQLSGLTTSELEKIVDNFDEDSKEWFDKYAKHVNQILSPIGFSAERHIEPVASCVIGMHDLSSIASFVDAFTEISDDTSLTDEEKSAKYSNIAVGAVQMAPDSKDYVYAHMTAVIPWLLTTNLFSMGIRTISVLGEIVKHKGDTAGFSSKTKEFIETHCEKLLAIGQQWDEDHPDEVEMWTKLLEGRFESMSKHAVAAITATFFYNQDDVPNALKTIGLELPYIPEELQVSVVPNKNVSLHMFTRCYAMWRNVSQFVNVPLVLEAIASKSGVKLPKPKKLTKAITEAIEDAAELFD